MELSPSPQPVDQDDPFLDLLIERLRSKGKRLLATISAEDLALVTGPPRTEYSKKRDRARKTKGGSPPRDYDGIEALVDLAALIKEEHPNLHDLWKSIYKLSAMVKN
jgi:hypothetical protein